MTDTNTTERPLSEAQQQARHAAELIPISGTGVDVQNFAQQVDYAKWVSKAGAAVPKHLRENVGACLAVLDLSQRWGFSPFQVARLCYVVNDILAFESQLIVAVINKFAPLKQRLRYEYEGEGETRMCIVTGHMKDEIDPLIYRSPPVGKISPKNSPLWKSDQDQQLAYYSGRAWSRRYCPDILMGIYGRDEDFIGPDNAKDVTPSPGLHERLQAASANGHSEGFKDGIVETALDGATETATHAPEPAAAAETAPKRKPRQRASQAELEPSTPPQEDTTAAKAQPDIPHAPPAGQADAMLDNYVPKSWQEYVAHADAWIAKVSDPAAGEGRWQDEAELRDTLSVPVVQRNALSGKLREKLEGLA